MRKLLLALAFSVLSFFPASANWTGKDATPATITFYNPAVCTSVVCVPVFQLTDGTNQVTLTTAGADGVSNTLTGQPVYGRMFNFNGTTWDRWTGAVKLNATPTLANGNGVVPTQGGAVLSATNGLYANILQGNAVNSLTNPFFMSPSTGAAWSITAASGSVSSGAYSSGAFASGSIGSGAMVDLGAIADAAATAGSTGTLSAKARLMTTQLGTINTTLGTPMQNSGGSVTANLGTIGTAATAANQTTGNTSLATIATNTTGASTAALQTTGNTSLATIATNSGLPLPAQSNTTTNVGAVSGIVNVTPTDCSGTVTTGGTAQSAISASATIHGFTIANVDASAGSGEPLWISFTGTASAANGSYPLAPPAATTFASNGSYTTPMGFGANHAVSVFAATTGHKFSCTTW